MSMYLSPRSYANFSDSALQKAIINNDIAVCQKEWHFADDEVREIAFTFALNLKYFQVLPIMIDSMSAHRIQQALGTSCENGSLECVNLLLKAGADPTEEGSEALWLACQGGHEEIVARLIPLCPAQDYAYALAVAAMVGEVGCARLLFPVADINEALLHGQEMAGATQIIEAMRDHDVLSQTLAASTNKRASKKKI